MFKAIKRWLGPTLKEYERNVKRHADQISGDDNVDAAWEDLRKEIEFKPTVKEVAEGLEIGMLSNNVNWIQIEKLGEYLSPCGNDNKHVVTLYKTKRKAGIVKVLEIECTNAVYSEWIQCLCETMWHTQHKVLEDIHGNKYPVGQMLELDCSIEYT